MNFNEVVQIINNRPIPIADEEWALLTERRIVFVCSCGHQQDADLDECEGCGKHLN